jgi:hypothetical protein
MNPQENAELFVRFKVLTVVIMNIVIETEIDYC